jgi:hypothetical protein
MPTKHPPSVGDDSGDGISQPVRKKFERGRLSTTTTIDRPKRKVTKQDKQNPSHFLAGYASAKMSKTAAFLPPIDDGENVPPFDDGVNQTKKTSLEYITEGHESVVVLPSEGIFAGNTNTKLISNVTTTDKVLPPTVKLKSNFTTTDKVLPPSVDDVMPPVGTNVTTTDKVLPPSVDDVMPPVGTSSINDKDTHVATGNPLIDVSHVASIAKSAVPLDSSSEIGDISPVKKANLKIGDGNEKCDPWDK